MAIIDQYAERLVSAITAVYKHPYRTEALELLKDTRRQLDKIIEEMEGK